MFLKLLAKIANELRKLRIPYMVVGGQAVLLYGEPRLTKDIDITLGVGVDGLPKIKINPEPIGILQCDFNNDESAIWLCLPITN